MPKFGLIGHPIEHSQSPELFAEAYGGRLQYDLIRTPDFSEAWEIFLREYQGVNITAPFKEQAFAKAQLHSRECAAIGACNIAVKTPLGVKAYNSDYLAVRKLLTDAGLSTDSRIVVAGFGGAGKAAATAAKDMGFDVTVCNRSTGKAAGLEPLERLPGLLEGAAALIYTLPVAGSFLPDHFGDCLVIEANYASANLNSKATRYISGREWLKAQALTGFPLLTGKSPEAAF